MHTLIRHIVFMIFLLSGFPGKADVYVIIYATHAGKTGHTGIAVDNYQIRIRGNDWTGIHDTVKTNSLTYFDLWPKSDRKMEILKDTEPEYFRLPNSSAEREVTVESLLRYGIPHKEGYPCDGLLKISTTPAQDYALKQFLDKKSDEKRPFNTRKYNCTDFVIEALVFITQKPMKAREFIPMRLSSTPNRLYRKVTTQQAAVGIIRDASAKVKGSFIRERILYQFFHNNKTKS